MLKINETTIYLTRGDSALIQLTLTNKDGSAYVPASGDSIRFAMKRAMTDKHAVLLTVQIPINTLVLAIEPEMTEELKYNKVIPYKYDIELTSASGQVDTFIADADLYLLPEVGVHG